eukprot:TRINITY_DN12464_c0_g1_i1.p1 TRINITY_DN12464_c0_g1~~TRINITY_DN12464_c0_g1_i1.p1  ORF type:complete len:418 (+),score=74.17 TRINITY_DN12464_c0_g1_i1:276-1529(+)
MSMHTQGERIGYFFPKEDVIKYVETNWETLCQGHDRNCSYIPPIEKALISTPSLFRSGEKVIGKKGYFSLLNPENPALIRDNPEYKTKNLINVSATRGKKRGNEGEEVGKGVSARKKTSSGVPVIPPESIYVPGNLYTTMCLAKENSAPQAFINDSENITRNDKGYRMIRASHCADEGEWYYEIEILNLGSTGHTRLGWSTQRSDKQGPVGSDKYSYGFRDIDGSIFHESRGTKYGTSFTTGDVIGYYIKLPKKSAAEETQKKLSMNLSKRVLAELMEEPSQLRGSKIAFYKNGQFLGTAFENLYKGSYYPAASLYMGATVKFNFGPSFQYAPHNVNFKPACDLAPKEIIILADTMTVVETTPSNNTNSPINITNSSNNNNNGNDLEEKKISNSSLPGLNGEFTFSLSDSEDKNKMD